MSRRQERYNYLRLHNFLPLEARELSKLPKRTPALKQMVADRDERRARFEKIAARKIAMGRWRRTQVQDKWIKNLSRLYTKRGWRVKEGGKGRQQKMAKFSPNPWAMYRQVEKQAPDKGYVSPWQVRMIRQGKTRLDKGLLFVQGAEKRSGALPKSTIRQWIAQKERAIKKARGARREQLTTEKGRLERLIK